MEEASSHEQNREKSSSSNQCSISPLPEFRLHGERSVFYFESHFHKAIWPVLFIGQLFAVMPVIGIRSRSISDLHFKWKSLRTVYSLLVIAVLISYTLLLIWKTFSVQVQFSSFALLWFYTSNTCTMICFLRLASKWPVLMKHWEIAETKLPTFRNEKQRRKFTIKIRTFAFIILAMALVENTLSVVSLLHFVTVCQKDKDPITELLKVQAAYLFPSGNKIFVLIFGKFINIWATFVWSFLDVFIMMISIGLSTMFKLYNADLKRARGENTSVDYWIFQRSQYAKLRDLITTVDQKIGQLTVLSFANLLFFSCKMILLSIRPMPTYIRMLYYWFSVGFLILRAVAVSLSAAHIHDESREVINILYTVPPPSFNRVAHRFFDEVDRNTIALSGMKFFFLTRKMILSVAATIVTYELVLLELQSSKPPTTICFIAMNNTF